MGHADAIRVSPVLGERMRSRDQPNVDSRVLSSGSRGVWSSVFTLDGPGSRRKSQATDLANQAPRTSKHKRLDCFSPAVGCGTMDAIGKEASLAAISILSS